MWAVHLSSTILTLSADAVVVAILAIVLGGLAPLQLCLGAENSMYSVGGCYLR